MIGQVVGNYRIVDRLGDGGMGSVYRAVDRMLDREVAIKVLRPELAQQTALVERFRQEAIALARLSHPNIATLHGLEQHGEQLLMIMEYVRGDTLEAIIQRSGRVTWARACELCVDVLHALDHAHDQGVVHRDIKPANIMLSSRGTVKVMDFGIARLMGRSRQTKLGHAVGTPTYMAPEQLRGHEVDGRTDLYAVAAVLFELVTGRMAFEADSDYSLMMKQLMEPAPPLSQLVPDVPHALDEIVLTAMAKSPDDRFPDAMTFANRLQGLTRAISDPARELATPATRLAADPRVAPVPAKLAAIEVATEAVERSQMQTKLVSDVPATPPDFAPAAPSPDAALTRLADAAPTRLADATPTRLADATPTRLADAAPTRLADMAPPTRLGVADAERITPPLPPRPTAWVRDWRSYAAIGAVCAVAAFGVRAYRASVVPETPGAGVVDTTTTAGATDSLATVASGASTPGDDAASLIIPSGSPPAEDSVTADSTSNRSGDSTGTGDGADRSGGRGRVTPPPTTRRPAPPPAKPDPTPPTRAEPVKSSDDGARANEGTGTGAATGGSGTGNAAESARSEERGESATAAREAIRDAIRDVLSGLGDRNGAVAQAVLEGGLTSQWVSLAREGRVSVNSTGTPNIDVAGSRASATFDASVNVRSPFGANKRRPARFSVELQRSGASWRVTSIRPIGSLSLD